MHRIDAKLFVSSLSKAEAFYCGVLGLDVQSGDEAGGYLLIQVGSGYLVLVRSTDSTPEDQQLPVNRKTGIIITTPFHSRLFAPLVEGGASILRTYEPAWGGKETIFLDPFGNELSLFSVGGQSSNAGLLRLRVHRPPQSRGVLLRQR